MLAQQVRRLATGGRSFRVAVASHVRISAQRSTRINVLTGADHEAVKVQAGLLPVLQLRCLSETGVVAVCFDQVVD